MVTKKKARMKRLDYKMQGKAIPMFKFGKLDTNKVVVTEEDKALRREIMKLELRLNRIQGKIKMGFKVREVEKKRIPVLKARIEHLKGKLFKNHSPQRTIFQKRNDQNMGKDSLHSKKKPFPSYKKKKFPRRKFPKPKKVKKGTVVRG